MTVYKPWYYRRRCPLFFKFCLPTYRAVHPFKSCLLVTSLLLWLFGALTLISVIIACTAVQCTTFAAALVPLACLAMWVGYFALHCAWASHLLDQPPDDEEESVSAPTLKGAKPIPTELDLEEQKMEELSAEPLAEQTDDMRGTGYWKFVEDEPWQIKCNRNELR
ncbi:hypothetical protein M514_20758, partial [Trichuris suis]